MKPKHILLRLCLLFAAMLPAAAQAQFTFLTNADNTITITGYGGPGGDITIPGMINGMQVSCIGESAFENDYNLTGVTIPNGVTSIEKNAFNTCIYLTSVTIPDSVTSIEGGAFENCIDLTSATIPDSVTNLGSAVLWGCYSLTNATLPNGIKNFGDYAFYLCESLPNLIIPDGVTNIGQSAFYGCESLKSVTIPNSVVSIGNNAFSGCISLSRISIPYSVTNIDYNAFGSSSLTGIYFNGNAPTIDSNAFSGDNPSNLTIYYLPGTTGWDDISNQTGIPTALWLPEMQTADTSFVMQTNQFGFNINWASGQTVVVEASTNFAKPMWVPVLTNILTVGSVYFSDPRWTNFPSRFYRLRSP
jgi:BspA type Leucine rich repeat region (6 copies)